MPIYIDADGCPVKDEVYKVARRYALKVYVVANASLPSFAIASWHKRRTGSNRSFTAPL